MRNHIHMYNNIIHMSTYMYMHVLCSTLIQSVGSRVVECTFHYLHVHSCLISVYITIHVHIYACRNIDIVF